MDEDADELNEGILSAPPAVIGEGFFPGQFRFPLLSDPDKSEACVNISFLAGRYYPGLTERPLLKPYLPSSLSGAQNSSPRKTLEDPHIKEMQNYLSSLAGLSPGHINSMEAQYWRQSRLAMVKDADWDARVSCHKYWNPKDETPLQKPAPSKSPQRMRSPMVRQATLGRSHSSKPAQTRLHTKTESVADGGGIT